MLAKPDRQKSESSDLGEGAMEEEWEDDYRVEVREKVYQAALHVIELTKLSGMEQEYFIPEILRSFCRKYKQKELAEFWAEVYDFVYTYYVCLNKGDRIVLLPDTVEEEKPKAGSSRKKSKGKKEAKGKRIGIG